MMVSLLVAMMLMTPFADATQTAYATQDVEALRTLLQNADSRQDTLMARYRLYPLTEDKAVIDDIPGDVDDLPDASARELALLSGLWAYRAGEANFFNAIRYGRRSMNFLDAAKAKDAADPYVLLVEGQSYLFRPDIAGKDAAKAEALFAKLVQTLPAQSSVGISTTEAKTWLWLSMRENGKTEKASELHASMLSDSVPPLYRQFLADPPQV